MSGRLDSTTAVLIREYGRSQVNLWASGHEVWCRSRAGGTLETQEAWQMMLDGAEECQLSGPIGELVPFSSSSDCR
jgi:hypothetical protein